jgi:hypothetical protein
VGAVGAVADVHAWGIILAGWLLLLGLGLRGGEPFGSGAPGRPDGPEDAPRAVTAALPARPAAPCG